MKNDNLSTALNLVLAVLLILGVFFTVRTAFITRSLRAMQIQATQATQANGYRVAVESLAQDAIAYSKNNPNSEILRILQPVQAKPANR